jgi:hypothetical protein
MMTTLHLNVSRLALMRDIDDGKVWFSFPGGVVNVSTDPPQDVLGPATELRWAGLADVDFDAEQLGAYPYKLTGAGKTELAAADQIVAATDSEHNDE